MMRAFLALGGLILTAVGLIVTFSTGVVNGWAVLAVIGVGMLAIDQHLERKSAERIER